MQQRTRMILTSARLTKVRIETDRGTNTTTAIPLTRNL